jgi:hypothetical protein
MRPPLKAAAVCWGLAALIAIAAAIGDSRHIQLPHRPRAQSFDQENLKLRDSGCPSAVFVAPNGELQQC